jgi:capsid protein
MGEERAADTAEIIAVMADPTASYWLKQALAPRSIAMHSTRSGMRSCWPGC